jgi:phosphoglycerate kinase
MSFPDIVNVKCINELAIREKRVFIRTDYDIFPDIEDEKQYLELIKKSAPTIKHALEHNARVIIASHVGNSGQDSENSFSLEPAAVLLAELFDKEILFFEDCCGMGAQQMVRDLKPGNILVLENLRYNEDEEKGSSYFARELTKMCDVYINDAFAISNRNDTSVFSLPSLVDTKGISFQFRKEMEGVSRFSRIKKGDGFYFAVGGERRADKFGYIRSLLDVADKIIIGGEPGLVFLAAKGVNPDGFSFEKEFLNAAKEILKRAEVRNVEVVLPVDHKVTGETLSKTTVVKNEKLSAGKIPVDIGTESIKLFSKALDGCRHLIWTGPFGNCRNDKFITGSKKFAAEAVKKGANTLVCGKETEHLIKKIGLADDFGHVTSGSFAALELLINGTLPCLEVLK